MPASKIKENELLRIPIQVVASWAVHGAIRLPTHGLKPDTPDVQPDLGGAPAEFAIGAWLIENDFLLEFTVFARSVAMIHASLGAKSGVGASPAPAFYAFLSACVGLADEHGKFPDGQPDHTLLSLGWEKRALAVSIARDILGHQKNETTN